jgi:hypothetical protein
MTVATRLALLYGCRPGAFGARILFAGLTPAVGPIGREIGQRCHTLKGRARTLSHKRNWLPLVDALRTFFLAPSPELRETINQSLVPATPTQIAW